MPENEKTIDQVPPRVRDMFNKGFAAMEIGNLEYAIDLFFDCVEQEPLFLNARKFLRAAEVRLFKSRRRGPLAHAAAFLSGLTSYAKAMANLKAGRAPQALAAAETLLRTDPLNKHFIRLFGQAAEAQDMPEVALQTVLVARDHYPNDLDLTFWLGQLYLKTKQPSRAKDCFEIVHRARPSDAQTLKALKDALAEDSMQADGWETAAQDGTFRDVIKDQREAEVLEREKKAVKTARDVEMLIEEQLEKIKREPGNINYYRTLASLYAESRMFAQSFATLEKAQQVIGRPDPQVENQVYILKLKQFDHEIEQLNGAGNAAAAEARAKQKEAFREKNLHDRVKRYPNDPQLRYDLGLLLLERSDVNGAIQQFQISQRNPQRRIRSLLYIGLCFKQKKQYDLAIEQLEHARSEIPSMDDTKKEILYELGELYEAVKNTEKAAACYKQIYQSDIGYRDIADKVERIYRTP